MTDPKTVDDLLEDLSEGDQEAKGQLLSHMVELAQREHRRGCIETKRKILDSLIEGEL